MKHLIGFDFGDSNTIIIGGGTESPSLTGAEFVKIKPQIRGVIGGTGKYMGARGQLTTIRNDDVISYWVNYNNCDTDPTITSFQYIFIRWKHR